MLLPNKLFSYNQSVLSKLPAFLTALDKPINPKALYQSVRGVPMSPIEFMEILDCLYALNKIAIDNEGRLYRC